MYLHSKESLTLIKDLMTVQQELEKIQVECPSKDQSKLFGRDCKVSSIVHRLRDPPRSRPSPNSLYFRESVGSKISANEMSWQKESLTEKPNSNDKKSFFYFPEEVTSRDTSLIAREPLSRKPPVKPSNRSSSSSAYDAMRDYSKVNKDFKTHQPSKVYADYEENRMSHRLSKGFIDDISPQVSPYNDCRTTKTHLMNKSPKPNCENEKPMQERLTSKPAVKSNIMSSIRGAMPNSCEISREYGPSDKPEERLSKRDDLNYSAFKEVEYNGGFNKKVLLPKPSPNSRGNTPIPNSSKVEELRQKWDLKEVNKKALRSQSANPWGQEDMTEKKQRDIEFEMEMEKENQTVSHQPLALRPDLNLFHFVREGDLEIGNKETGSTRETESIGGTCTFGPGRLEKRTKEYDRQVNRASLGFEYMEPESKGKRSKTSPSAVNYQRKERSGFLTLDEGEVEMMESLSNGKSSSKNKGGGIDKSQLMKAIIELKNQVHEKELEILELRNRNVASETENTELQIQIGEVIKINKRNEDSLGKLQHQVECQEKEIEFLKKCKQRLEDNFRNNTKASAELKEYTAKVAKCEQIIEEKNSESYGLLEKLRRVEAELNPVKEDKMKLEIEVQRLKDELMKKDYQIATITKEGEENKKKIEEFMIIVSKLGELEDLQNQLIQENTSLKQQLADQQMKTKETEALAEQIYKEGLTQLSMMNKRLREINEYARKLLVIVEAVFKGEEPPIEVILKHNRGLNENGNKNKYNENDEKYLNIAQLSQQSIEIVEKLHYTFGECMDKICENYVLKYGNECNLQ